MCPIIIIHFDMDLGKLVEVQNINSTDLFDLIWYLVLTWCVYLVLTIYFGFGFHLILIGYMWPIIIIFLYEFEETGRASKYKPNQFIYLIWFDMVLDISGLIYDLNIFWVWFMHILNIHLAQHEHVWLWFCMIWVLFDHKCLIFIRINLISFWHDNGYDLNIFIFNMNWRSDFVSSMHPKGLSQCSKLDLSSDLVDGHSLFELTSISYRFDIRLSLFIYLFKYLSQI